MTAKPVFRRVLWFGALLALAAVLVALPFALHPARQFSGSDDKAAALIAAMPSAPQPWFHLIWQPATEGAKNILFGFQAALGLALLGACWIGLRRRQKASAQETPDHVDD
jgi:cobalt transport protein